MTTPTTPSPAKAGTPDAMLYMFRVKDPAQNHRIFKEVLDPSDDPDQWTLYVPVALTQEPVAYVKFRSGQVDYDSEIVISSEPGDRMDESEDWLPVSVSAHIERQVQAQAEPVGEVVGGYLGPHKIAYVNEDAPNGAKLYLAPPAQAKPPGELPPRPTCDASFNNGRFYSLETMEVYARAHGEQCYRAGLAAQAAGGAVPKEWREFVENIATPRSEPMNSVCVYRDRESRNDMAGKLRDAARQLLELSPAATLPPAKAQGPGELAAMHECGACLGSGWVVRDPDIGTDQECFACGGSGKDDEQNGGAV